MKINSYETYFRCRVAYQEPCGFWRSFVEKRVVIDDDFGRSGSSVCGRTEFARLVADVALNKAGIVFGLEVSRLARNNRDWYQLLDLCSMTLTKYLLEEGLTLPRKATFDRKARWVRPFHRAVYKILTNPIHAGAYVFGRSRVVTTLDVHGHARSRQITIHALLQILNVFETYNRPTPHAPSTTTLFVI
jgi:hypothetical protein